MSRKRKLEVAWQHPLNLHEGLGPLQSALLTTYDPPEPDALLETFLPRWLGIDRDTDAGGSASAAYEVELSQRLVHLKKRIGIFSTWGRSDEQPHWLWRFVDRYHVGRSRRAVQHAKLWLFHHGQTFESPETLVVVVSSTNLTSSALRGQIQAGWHARLPLMAGRVSDWERGWGPLPEFLRALGAACGESAARMVKRWLTDVFPRTVPPADVEFIASVPGEHRRRDLTRSSTAWGLAGLRRSVGQGAKIDILVPTVGNFDARSLAAWANAAGTTPNKLALAWVPRGHPWSASWQAPHGSLKALTAAKGELIEVPPSCDAPSFHKEQSANDDRWWHGKLYRIRNRGRVLITSANWSCSAWGKAQGKRVRIENFELGVLVPGDWPSLDRVSQLEEKPHATAPAAPEIEPLLCWAEAWWNGKALCVDVRVANECRPRAEVLVHLAGSARRSKIGVRWRRFPPLQQASVAWRAARGEPIAVEVIVEAKAGTERHIVHIADDRPKELISRSPVNGMEIDQYEHLSLKVLEERYGGRSVDETDSPDDTDGPESESDLDGDDRVHMQADYGVEALIRVRAKLAIIDCWSARLDDSADHGISRENIILDGERLAEGWRTKIEKGIAGLDDKIAASELEARLQKARA